MGMFDTLIVSDNLPYSEEMICLGLNSNDGDFQTKDLENLLETYILQDKKLFVKKYKVNEYIQPDLEQVIHHGKVNFYTSHRNVLDVWDCWEEYEATFSNGICENIVLVKFTKESNKERLEREKEWEEELIRNHNLWYNKYIFHTLTYRKFSLYRYKFFTAIANFFHQIA
jgi:hypothetical protein